MSAMEFLFFILFPNLLPCSRAQISSFFQPSPSANVVGNSVLSGQQGRWQTLSHNAPVLPDYSAVTGNGQGRFQGLQVMTEPWAQGEPGRVFSTDPEIWFNSCQRTGCPRIGTQCVFWGGFCPSSVIGVPCSCRRGCKVDNIFIPMGRSRVMDVCNNICTCGTLEGRASCTTRRC